MTYRILYILGAGRSGSTLLERLIGSAPGAVAVGELHCLWRLPLEQLTCACGAPARACDFWRDVRARSGLTDGALAELRSLETRSIRHRRIASHRGRLTTYLSSAEVGRFVARQRALFDAIAEVSGAYVLIDNSKAAPRAWALSGLPEVQIAHLRRRPADVVAAWRRIKHDPSLGGPMRRPSAPAAAADWLITEASAARLARRRPVTRIGFEDFVSDPESTVSQLGLAPDGVAWTGPKRFLPDQNYHALNGNPDRFTRGEIVIQPPARPNLPLHDRAAAAAIGAALQRVSP